MSACFFQSDARYRRYLAERPGLWAEVGVFDDLMALAGLRAEREALGLTPSSFRMFVATSGAGRPCP